MTVSRDTDSQGDAPRNAPAPAAPRGEGAAAGPSFAAEFPRDPELDAAVDAFSRGDYAEVRTRARALARGADADVRRAAQTLLERTRPDPLAVALLAMGGVLLVVLSAWWIVHGHAP